MKWSAEAEFRPLVDEGCRIVVSASVFSYLIAVSYFQKAKGVMQWHLFCHKVGLYEII